MFFIFTGIFLRDVHVQEKCAWRQINNYEIWMNIAIIHLCLFALVCLVWIQFRMYTRLQETIMLRLLRYNRESWIILWYQRTCARCFDKEDNKKILQEVLLPLVHYQLITISENKRSAKERCKTIGLRRESLIYIVEKSKTVKASTTESKSK